MSRFKNAFLGIIMAIESLFTISCSNYKILSVELDTVYSPDILIFDWLYYENGGYSDLYKRHNNSVEVTCGSTNAINFCFNVKANYEISAFSDSFAKYEYDKSFIKIANKWVRGTKTKDSNNEYSISVRFYFTFLKVGQTTINVTYNKVQIPFTFSIIEFNKTNLEVYETHSQLSDEEIGFNEHAICYFGVLFSVTDIFEYKDIFNEEFFEDNCLIAVTLEKYDCYDSYPTCDIMLENKNIYVRTNIKLKKGTDISTNYYPATGDMTYLYYPISKDSIYIKDNWPAVDRSKTQIHYSYHYL